MSPFSWQTETVFFTTDIDIDWRDVGDLVEPSGLPDYFIYAPNIYITYNCTLGCHNLRKRRKKYEILENVLAGEEEGRRRRRGQKVACACLKVKV